MAIALRVSAKYNEYQQVFIQATVKLKGKTIMKNINQTPVTVTSEFPNIHDRALADDLACALECANMCAYFLAGDDQLDLRGFAEQLDMTMEEYNPDAKYTESLYELDDEISGYNHDVRENGLVKPLLCLVVDEEKSKALKDTSIYQIHQVLEQTA